MACNHILYDRERNEYFCGKFRSSDCQETQCKAISSIKHENGFIVDYRHIYYGKTKDGAAKWGWRAFHTDYSFIGLLDESKLAIWYVDEQSLEIK